MATTVEIIVQGVDEASGIFSDIEKQAESAFSNIESSASSISDSFDDIEIDISVGDIESSIDGAVDSVSDISDAFEDAEQSVLDFEDTSNSVFDTLADNWGKIALGASGAGIAVETMARSQADLTNQTNRVARATELTSKEARDLASSMQNATFPMNEVTELMEIASQRGLTSAQDIESYATTWDMIGDATGENSRQLARAGVALESLGITAGSEEQALSAFGYITESTTMSVTDFLNSVERVSPELSGMGLDVNETAALFGILENEMGMSGRTARQELRKALNEADGDFEVLLDTLGVSEDTFRDYTSAVQESSDVISANADDVADNMTAMQRLNAWVENLTYSYGPLIQGASALVPLMLALGPAIKGVQMATQLFNMTLLASPITWIVAGIIALITVIYLLWNNWDTVSQWLSASWEWIKSIASNVFGFLGDFIGNIWESIKNVTSNVWNFVKNLISDIWNAIKNTISNIINSIRDTISNIWNSIKNTIQNVINSIRDTINNIWNRIKSITSDIWNGLRDTITNIIDSVKNRISNTFNSIKNTIENIWNKIKSITDKIWSSIVDSIRGAINGIIRPINGIIEGINRVEIKLPTIPDWVPGIGGKGGGSIGFPNLPTIPYLATGGLVTDETLAVIGEGADDEAVIPLNKTVLSDLGEKIGRYTGNGNGPIDYKKLAQEIAKALAEYLGPFLQNQGDVRLIIQEMVMANDYDVLQLSRELRKIQQRSRKSKGYGLGEG